jgi:hypothetical protein
MAYDEKGMISSDKSKHANLPTEAVMKQYPMAGGYIGGELGNEYVAANKQMNKDHAALKSSYAPKKY